MTVDCRSMKGSWAIAVVAIAILVPLLSAAQQDKAEQSQQPKGQGVDLGRPTKVGDEEPLFNFDDYFGNPGKWTFEWEAPDGIFGPGGTTTGTTVYKHLDGPFYQADTDAKGPSG